jgi:hypothetical protein
MNVVSRRATYPGLAGGHSVTIGELPAVRM